MTAAVFVAAVPRPPPSCPTITSDVGTRVVPLLVVKVSLLVRLMVRLPGATVMMIGDQFVPAFGFAAAQVARVGVPVQV